jgi:NhaP-type Na+/H+ or K+/H+ antiporter
MTWPIHVTKLNAITTFLSLFMVVFMLLSSFFTRTLFLGPAPVALIIGTVFGPRSAKVINPLSWAKSNTITLEFSRIVLALQSFGNAVELPKYYVKKHWKSLAYTIGPVMLCGWLITTCCLRIMVPPWNWRQCLVCAAGFNAIDPVLAATILSGQFSKRVPLHLRHLLRMEAAANGLTTTVILELAVNLLLYRDNPGKIAGQTLSIALAYGSIFSALGGFLIGYIARIILRKAHEGDTIDRPSFLAYYLSIAVFSMGLGAIIGVDEVNLAFFAGVGLDNDNWYERKTEESFLSSCIDLMLNLSYFGYVGSLIPWKTFDSRSLGLVPWRLVMGALCIFTFRRLPAVLLFSKLIPDIRTWREACFYGHFGPIGAGALFSALFVRGRLTPGSGEAVDAMPQDQSSQDFLNQLWSVSMFAVVCSTIVHGTSIAIFYLGRKINTLTITVSYTPPLDDGPSWMSRLPKIQSLIASEQGDVFTTRTPAIAYQFGNTIIVEGEDGEVIKRYELPATGDSTIMQIMTPAGRATNTGKTQQRDAESQPISMRAPSPQPTFTLSSGRRLTKEEFIRRMQQLDPGSHTQPTTLAPNLEFSSQTFASGSATEETETIVERRRREAALGISSEDEHDFPSFSDGKGKGRAE